MRHRKEAINWIAIKSEPSHRALWAKLCLLVFIPGVLGSHGKFVSRAVDSDKIQFAMYEAHYDWKRMQSGQEGRQRVEKGGLGPLSKGSGDKA